MSNSFNVAAAGAVVLAITLVTSGCGDTETPAVESEPSAESMDDSQSENAVFDSSTVHTIAIDFDQEDYDTMVETYLSSSEKDWIEASISIDGVTYEQAGLRMKGNSSLQRLSNNEGGSFDDPSGVPWLIRLDKFVDGQSHEGVNDFVVRSNGSETALNEAVSLDLLEAAGLATQDAMSVRFSVNGSDEVLRLVIENPDDVWLADNFDSSDALYKAESTGDYSYRGDDEDSYDEVFDQEAGKANTNLSPLIEFLDFINNSDDETFDADLESRFDVESFANYLAMQEIVDNFDDIDGPGNNSYLHWDSETGRFTVVPWDYNESFGYAGGTQGGTGGGAGGGRGGVAPGDETAPNGGQRGGPDQGGQPIGPETETLPEGNPAEPQQDAETSAQPGRGAENVLVQRFNNNERFNALYVESLAELKTNLVDSGMAEGFLEDWVTVLGSEADDLVPSETLNTEAEVIRAFF